MRPFLLMACLLASPAAAQDLVFDGAAIETCLAGDTGFEDCIGVAADRCMADTEGGQSTVGMGACLQDEAQWWDDRLNAAYQRLMSHSREMDGMNGPYAPSQAKALRAMQRAWIAFRDAKCAYARSQWGGGTGGGPAAAACVMRETAMQSRVLETALPN